MPSSHWSLPVSSVPGTWLCSDQHRSLWNHIPYYMALHASSKMTGFHQISLAIPFPGHYSFGIQLKPWVFSILPERKAGLLYAVLAEVVLNLWSSLKLTWFISDLADWNLSGFYFVMLEVLSPYLNPDQFDKYFSFMFSVVTNAQRSTI